MHSNHLPLLAVAAYSGTGKTTLLKHVIPLLINHGVRIGLIKHTHHQMDIDTPGKDSYELRKAGAAQTIVASNQRWALMTETPEQEEPNIYELVGKMDTSTLDLILVEGFKHEKIAKIALFRQSLGRELSDLIDEYVIAIAADTEINTVLPVLDINQPEQVANFIHQWLQLQNSRR
ncbi:molybdopterin-guanine dinucleotide biosynthesis protein MobB [Pectobacterium aroidearum]|uniref:molybdopterin-guanine dinucleotide biosynthesis protein MobB n=1 Tax=Pectobacterium aroidearum TaxID=1201031 RepID=UPI00211508A4|nr:molybdopterin-guanine dinucleotide biosynthesis protein MobB [Pectobacterium aroidearum]UUE36330.1 molybdopterin-guanine dinucleotide biosynthesis protein MobB [Pectobacterium aroidearum]UUE40703.1 molybdopterin-guanine dinucleotide biosynthesis protein MobB [Pectobacterium aroidearum]UUE57669.1 molybdopterin-guanine dinucleotide biosynthesis protein MobB [Pectobacterium aroidearum]UUE70374.1 molybdopterin-guanine dinucleotide biosynthesis protein MobB [Pectobacterium aroidearum]UUE74752.1 